MTNLFKVQLNCLRLMGHNFEDEKLQRKYFEGWQTIKHICLLLFVASAQLPMFYYVLFNIDDMLLMTAGLSICFTNILTVIKITTFLIYKKKFVKIMTKLQNMFEQLHEVEAKNALTAENKTVIKLVKVYFYMCSSTGIYFMFGPLIKMFWAFLHKQTLVKELPMPMRFPFDFLTTPGYEICYFYTTIVTVCVVMYASAVDGLFLSFSINIKGHFMALQNFIKMNTFLKSEKNLQNEISAYVQYHQFLLDLTEEVRVMYKPIIFGQFLITSLQVCVIVYQLVTRLDSVMILASYLTFFCAIMLQLFIYCYGGELLKFESLMVAIAIQLSNWYNLPPKYRRMMCFTMQRAQRVIIIKAGFYVASLENFMMILKAAMSLVTLIQSIAKN